LSTIVVNHVRDVHTEIMDNVLSVWIEDNVQKNMPLSGPLICTKVMRMYTHLVGVGGVSTSDSGTSDVGTSGPSLFQGSRGWFDRFKKHYGLHNIKLIVERASADQKTAETSPAQLVKLTQEKWYLPEKVLNADETSLF